LSARRALLAVAVAALAALGAACVPVAPPPVVQTCDPHWRGYVLPSDHNYAGIGAYNGSDRFMCKPTPRQGIRAQIQHLRNYADPASTPYNLGAPLETRPGYDASNFTTFVYHGAAPRWIDLEGRWAVPGTTYWDTIKNICDNMRASAGFAPLSLTATIMGARQLTAAQMGAYVRSVGNPWKPEITPESMAGLYIDEGNKAGVRGDIAFCQSILETGWFSWPSSPAAASTQATTNAAPGSQPSSTTTTTTTTPGDPNTTTTTVPGEPTTTTSTTTPPPPAALDPVPVLDPVLAAYFELQQVTVRY
jgi:hypothetical protein